MDNSENSNINLTSEDNISNKSSNLDNDLTSLPKIFNSTDSVKTDSEKTDSVKTDSVKTDSVKIPKKRGRKPKPKSNDTDSVKIPKKRGRKPKPKSTDPTSVKIPKKRGRKPKPKPLNEPPKIPKKRGRKPKEKSYGIIKDTKINDIDSDNIILHLPINSKNIIQTSKEAEILTYDPVINEPVGWQSDTLAGNPIDAVAFLDKTSQSSNLVHVTSKVQNYSHYPFDEKENEIVEALVDSDDDIEVNIINDTEDLREHNTNIVEDIDIQHNNEWFENKNIESSSVSDDNDDLPF